MQGYKIEARYSNILIKHSIKIYSKLHEEFTVHFE